MIPRLRELEPVARVYAEFLIALRDAGFAGDVHPDYATRLSTATDNSVYQILPQAVVYPAHADDIMRFVRLAAEPRFSAVTFTPRGGGTGTNGQSLSDGLIVDVSRHMDHIVELDLDAGWVRVEPGVVLDQLNAHLRPHGVFFAPNLSPSSRATIGGMISTDACGKGSRIYGRTSQHVLSLTTVLLDGTTWVSAPLGEQELASIKRRDDRAGEVHRVVDEVVTTHAGLIAERFPQLQRFMTGYDLAHVRRTPADGEPDVFDLTRILTGSEGTLAITVEARLRLTPIPTHRRLVVLRYSTFEDALGSAELVVGSNPGAIETIDETVLGLARGDVIWHDVGPLLADAPGEPATAAINLVEYEGDDPAAVDARAQALIDSVAARCGEPDHPFGWVVAQDAAQSAALWSLRKKGVGLLGNAPGPRKPIAFVEDTVVPPARLRDYVREFRAILDDAGLRYGMFGHIDVGCLHVRPALDLKDPADERLLRRISDQVVKLVQRYGGQVWGEHGKGMRSEYNPTFFGPALFEQLCRVKAAFDPTGRLNPGKLAVPPGGAVELASVDAPKRGALDRQIPEPVRALFAEALDCNGNGACFDVDPDHVMCPSSKITRSRIHSPKGRAGVMREWLRQLAGAGVNPIVERARPASWLGGVARAWRRIRRHGEYDYSHEVYAAMDGCLSCKACATRCPIKVDVPRFRSEFLQLYHGRYGRPLRDRLVGRLEGLVAWMARIPRVANALTQSRPARWLLEHTVGMVDPPPLSVRTAAAGLRARGVWPYHPRQLTARPASESVALLPDAFTTFYEAEVLLATVDVLRRLDLHVVVLPYRPSGKGLHVKGFLHRFKRVATASAAALAQVAESGIPIVGLDPAVALIYRDEVPHALGTAMPELHVQMLHEWLASQPGRLAAARPPAGGSGESFRLMAHCTERTAQPATAAQWRAIFKALGLGLEVPLAGCCGMCGAYGHERHHVDESRGIFELSWERHLGGEETDRARTLATGHSCRSQVKRFAGFRPRHPMEALNELLSEESPG